MIAPLHNIRLGYSHKNKAIVAFINVKHAARVENVRNMTEPAILSVVELIRDCGSVVTVDKVTGKRFELCVRRHGLLRGLRTLAAEKFRNVRASISAKRESMTGGEQ